MTHNIIILYIDNRGKNKSCAQIVFLNLLCNMFFKIYKFVLERTNWMLQPIDLDYGTYKSIRKKRRNFMNVCDSLVL